MAGKRRSCIRRAWARYPKSSARSRRGRRSIQTVREQAHLIVTRPLIMFLRPYHIATPLIVFFFSLSSLSLSSPLLSALLLVRS